MHIPPPLQAALCASMYVIDGFSVVKKVNYKTYIYDMLCVPAYENRIVISCPEHAIYENEPLIVIELEYMNNYPNYYELN